MEAGPERCKIDRREHCDERDERQENDRPRQEAHREQPREPRRPRRQNDQQTPQRGADERRPQEKRADHERPDVDHVGGLALIVKLHAFACHGRRDLKLVLVPAHVLDRVLHDVQEIVHLHVHELANPVLFILGLVEFHAAVDHRLDAREEDGHERAQREDHTRDVQ